MSRGPHVDSARRVYEALRLLGKPSTRAEIEEASGLNKDSVRAGLARLRTVDMLHCHVRPRQTGRYWIKAGFFAPEANPKTMLVANAVSPHDETSTINASINLWNVW